MFYEDEVGEPEVVKEKARVKELDVDWAARPSDFDAFEPQYVGYKYNRQRGTRQWYWLDWSDNSPKGPQKEKITLLEVPQDVLKLANKRSSSNKKTEYKGQTKEYAFKNRPNGRHQWFKSSDSGKSYERVKASKLPLKKRCELLEKAKEPTPKSCLKTKKPEMKKTEKSKEERKRKSKEYTYDALLKHGNFLFVTGDDKYILVSSRKTSSAKPRPRFYKRQPNGKYAAVKKKDVPLQTVLDAQDELEAD